jgi:hypothetical protein
MKMNEVRKMKLTRKHFTLAAEIIGHIDNDENREVVASGFGDLFAETHDLFDQDKFNAKVKEVHQACWEDNGPWYGA